MGARYAPEAAQDRVGTVRLAAQKQRSPIGRPNAPISIDTMKEVYFEERPGETIGACAAALLPPPASTDPYFLVTESTVYSDGIGPNFELSAELRGKLLLVTLGITQIMERQGITVTVWGSPDKTNWGTEPLASFAQKYCCGCHSVLLNLVQRKDVRFLRVQWQMRRWANRDATGMCAFYVSAE